MKIHLVLFNTFSNYGKNGYYDESIERLKSSFLQNGGDEIHHYNEETIPLEPQEREYFQKYKDKAFGFYGFKPIIILDVLNKITYGDIVFYHDAGRPEYNYQITKNLRLLATIVKENYQGLGLSHGGWSHNQLTRDICFKKMGCDTSYIRSNFQLAASWGFYEKNLKVINFVKDWKNWCLDYEVIRTEEQDEINHPGFQAHRWDQSILTNLLYLYSFKTLPNFNGWEKNINTFIHDFSKIEVCNTFNTVEGLTLIVDVFYKDGKLTVLTTGAIKELYLFDCIAPTEIIKDSHQNFHQFIFEVEFQPFVKFKAVGVDTEIDDRYLQFKLTNRDDYLKNKSIITAIFHNGINSLNNIKYFLNYHLNLGIDIIILHENSGENYINMIPELRKYIDSGRVKIKCLKGIKFFQQFVKASPGMANAGEVSHMNLTNCKYKEAKCIIPINVDEFVVIPDKKGGFNDVFNNLYEKYNGKDLGSFDYDAVDFGKPENNSLFYTSTSVIEPVNRYTKNIVFPYNVKTLTCHSTTSGEKSHKLKKEELYFNHYPFLDNKRALPPFKYRLETVNLNENFFNETY